SQLTECTMAPTTIACTTDANCSSLGTGFTCSVRAPATTGVCVGPNPLCDFDLILSTLSAHSFDFVVPVRKGKPHRVEAIWSVIGTGATSGAHVASCVGPGILTVTQYKVFNNSGALLSFCASARNRHRPADQPSAPKLRAGPPGPGEGQREHGENLLGSPCPRMWSREGNGASGVESHLQLHPPQCRHRGAYGDHPSAREQGLDRH